MFAEGEWLEAKFLFNNSTKLSIEIGEMLVKFLDKNEAYTSKSWHLDAEDCVKLLKDTSLKENIK